MSKNEVIAKMVVLFHMTPEEAREDFAGTVRYCMRGTLHTEADRAYAVKEAIEDYEERFEMLADDLKNA